MIPASPKVITYRSQKTKVPEQIKLYPPLDLNTKFIKGEIKNCFLLGFDPNFPGWETTIITSRLNSDVTVFLQFYISIQKVLEQLWKYFTFLKLCKCSWILHPLPREASTPIRTKTNHNWLYHLQTLHTRSIITLRFRKVRGEAFHP